MKKIANSFSGFRTHFCSTLSLWHSQICDKRTIFFCFCSGFVPNPSEL